MNRIAVKKLVTVIIATYPGYFRSYTVNDIDNMISAWERVLGDIDYQDADKGLTIYLRSDTKGFPPSPGQVLNCIISATEKPEDRIGELEAWSLVMQALRNSGDITRAREEFDALPGIVRATVGRPETLREWALDENFRVDVARGQFLRQFANMQHRIREEKLMYATTDSPRLEMTSSPVEQIEDKQHDIFIGGEWDDTRTRQIEELREQLRRNVFTA